MEKRTGKVYYKFNKGEFAVDYSQLAYLRHFCKCISKNTALWSSYQVLDIQKGQYKNTITSIRKGMEAINQKEPFIFLTTLN